MGIRRTVYRQARNGPFWFVVIFTAVFYLNQTSIINYADRINPRHSRSKEMIKGDMETNVGDPGRTNDELQVAERRKDADYPYDDDYDDEGDEDREDDDDNDYLNYGDDGDDDDDDDDDDDKDKDMNYPYGDDDDDKNMNYPYGDDDDKDTEDGDIEEEEEEEEGEGGGGTDANTGKGDEEKEGQHQGNNVVNRGDKEGGEEEEEKGQENPRQTYVEAGREGEEKGHVEGETDEEAEKKKAEEVSEEKLSEGKPEDRAQGGAEEGGAEDKTNGRRAQLGGEEGGGEAGADDDRNYPHSDLFFNGYYNVNETVDGKAVVKVLLLTYQRAGSSFAGELLTSGGGGSVYIYEPLYVWRKLLGPGAKRGLERDSAWLLGDLLDCRPQVLRAWGHMSYPYFHRRGSGGTDWCGQSSFRLTKTIRAREHFVHAWLQRRPDIKVLHLVRDPRGILYSVARGGGMWSQNNKDAALQCGYMEKDLTLQQLGQHRYLRVRYEDLVERPLEETQRVLGFLGQSVNQEVMEYMKQHTALGNHTLQTHKQGYMSTYRDGHFRHDKWKENMYPSIVTDIEKVCQSVMATMQYSPLKPV
ncbi:hypothetical protein Pmani_031865 [Petrolisthes manimaculis]|uniref:Sulfotransferase domain-containing protein n=1 Tax=Petrolisthes manimaculis TaxID=1843537 RepID=A0AAE1NSW2_9EUCA|nr:hypothetical protein Pmani_031865 [Petrolisthes manimaculis]